MNHQFLNKSILFGLVFGMYNISILSSTDLPPGFVQYKIAEGLNPTRIDILPDGDIFIANKNGQVFLVENDIFLPDPIYTIAVDSFNDRGLLGIRSHPEFESNGYLYLYYSVPNMNRNRVIRLTLQDKIPVPGSELEMILLDSLPGITHNGGDMVFDDNCKLFITTGEGQYAPNAQNLNSLLGKILRFNDDGSIPETNPFFNLLTGNLRSIWAYGVRNPFTIAFNQQTNTIFFNDVGSSFYEEINELYEGANYGWAIGEGALNNPSYKDPIYSYGRITGCAIVGGAFNYGFNSNFPSNFTDLYYYSDYCSGNIQMINPLNGEFVGDFASGIDRPLNIAFNQKGEMLYVERNGIPGGDVGANQGTNSGVLWKVIYSGTGEPVISVSPQSALLSEGESICLFVEAFGQEPLTYMWYLNDSLLTENNDTICFTGLTVSDSLSEIFCVAENEFGRDTSAVAIVSVTANQRPIVVFQSPSPGFKYCAGDSFVVKAIISDPEEGLVNIQKYRWRVDFYHNTHYHPVFQTINGDSIIIPVSRFGETAPDVFFRITLSAKDNANLTGFSFLDIHPQLVDFEIRSVPTNIGFNLNGHSYCSPKIISSVKGIKHDIIIPHRVFLSDSTSWKFENWNMTGSGSSITYFAKAETLIAHFTEEDIDTICPQIIHIDNQLDLRPILVSSKRLTLAGPLQIDNLEMRSNEFEFFPFIEILQGGRLEVYGENCFELYRNAEVCEEH